MQRGGGEVVSLLLILLLLVVPAAAQGDQPLVQSIGIGMEVEETISAAAPFDWWQIDGTAGETIAVEIEAYEGLAPLLGVLDANGTLLTRSADGTPNGTLHLQFQFPTSDTYTMVAGRVGLNDGTTTGRYILRVERVSAPATPDPAFQEVVFPCSSLGDAAVVATLTFRHEAEDVGGYLITVLGFDGFTPVIRFQSSEQATDVCVPPDQDDLALPYTLPDSTTGTSTVGMAAQLVVNPGGLSLGEITIMLGGLDSTPGRYLAVIEGFALQSGTDTDEINVRLGALPAESTALDVYMVGANNRLDPTVILNELPCDDAGRRGCADVPAIIGVGIGALVGDRFDAGAQLTDGQPHTITLASFANRTSGAYGLLLVGELPPRDFEN